MTEVRVGPEAKYAAESGWVYMTGTQALVRLPIQQRLRDAAAGLNTAGYISGYRGSPMGRFDLELWSAGEELKARNIVFRPGLNEDLAATAIWGSQYVGTFEGAKVDGVFGIWYGKGPGVDRSGDVFRHANAAGTSPKGGVIALAGDDHGAKSSTVVNFSDPIFAAVGIPVLYPSNTQEILDFGLHGIAMSRHSGCWVGIKLVTDVVEGGGSVYVAPDSPRIVQPPPVDAPTPDGLGIRAIDQPVAQEARLYGHKLGAALAYARSNGLNVIGGARGRASLGIVSAGKSWQDCLQALRRLGIDPAALDRHGIRTLKVGMTWPLDPVIVREFANGVETILVIEEKRPILEDQVRNALYGTPGAPRVIGKAAGGVYFDAAIGSSLLPAWGELAPDQIEAAIAQLLGIAVSTSPRMTAAAPVTTNAPVRTPGFCSGCPHNRSTRVLEGSRALAGIGCHTMAMFADPLKTTTVSHMGGEGAMWLGQQPFTTESHVFANIGDGTLAHSGYLAIRQAVAAGVPMTYKILYNGFVSLTGGQPIEGARSPVDIVHGLAAEGVRKLAIVTDDVERYHGARLPDGTTLHPRDALQTVEREFREYKGVSVIVYDQPCATERRRLRKRGKWADPPKRAFINAAVCEGCGDCGKASNCMSIVPLETEYGRKRAIDQANCNKDFSCVEGFCPSFVTVHGGSLRRKGAAAEAAHRPEDHWQAELPEPALPDTDGKINVLVAGVGGTGIVTVGQTLAVAAHLDGLYSSNLDLTGLSQKYGAVTSHVRIARTPDQLHANRIASGETDVLIGCDLLVSASAEVLPKLGARTGGVVCSAVGTTHEFARNPDWTVDGVALESMIKATCGPKLLMLDAQRLARDLVGDVLGANMFMLGAAWQLGLIPVSAQAIDRAIQFNGVAVPMNRSAFLWGRRAAFDLQAVERCAKPAGAQVIRFEPARRLNLDQLIERRRDDLVAYQGRALAKRYLALVDRVRAAEAGASLGDRLSIAVAQSYYHLLATKDEWEVARLYSRPEFHEELAAQFEGDYRLRFHVGAWPFAKVDRVTGRVRKAEVGSWLLSAFRLMAPLRFLRGSLLDPFRNNAERALDRQLLAQFESDVDRILAQLNRDNHATAVALARLPQRIRGFGHVRQQAAEAIARERTELLDALTVREVQRTGT